MIINHTADKPTGSGQGQVRDYIKTRCALISGQTAALAVGHVQKQGRQRHLQEVHLEKLDLQLEASPH